MLAVVAPTRMCAAQMGGSSGERGPAVRDQHARLGHSVSTNILAKAGWALSARVRRQRQFDVTGEFELAVRSERLVMREAAQFDIVLGGDGDFQNGFDAGDAAMELGAVGGEADGALARAAAKGLCDVAQISSDPSIADIDEAAPGIERGVGAPAGDIEFVPAAVAAAGVGDHQRVAAVAVQMDAREPRFLRSRCGPAVPRSRACGRAEPVLDLVHRQTA